MQIFNNTPIENSSHIEMLEHLTEEDIETVFSDEAYDDNTCDIALTCKLGKILYLNKMKVRQKKIIA